MPQERAPVVASLKVLVSQQHCWSPTRGFDSPWRYRRRSAGPLNPNPRIWRNERNGVELVASPSGDRCRDSLLGPHHDQREEYDARPARRRVPSPQIASLVALLPACWSYLSSTKRLARSEGGDAPTIPEVSAGYGGVALAALWYNTAAAVRERETESERGLTASCVLVGG